MPLNSKQKVCKTRGHVAIDVFFFKIKNRIVPFSGIHRLLLHYLYPMRVQNSIFWSFTNNRYFHLEMDLLNKMEKRLWILHNFGFSTLWRRFGTHLHTPCSAFRITKKRMINVVVIFECHASHAIGLSWAKRYCFDLSVVLSKPLHFRVAVNCESHIYDVVEYYASQFHPFSIRKNTRNQFFPRFIQRNKSK